MTAPEGGGPSSSPRRRRVRPPGSKGPKRLGAEVDRVLRDLGAPSGSAIERLLEAWPEVVGPVLAASTRPMAVRDGRLVVQADDPAVASTVKWSKTALIEALDRLVEPGVVRELDVRVGRPGGADGAPGRPPDAR